MSEQGQRLHAVIAAVRRRWRVSAVLGAAGRAGLGAAAAWLASFGLAAAFGSGDGALLAAAGVAALATATAVGWALGPALRRVSDRQVARLVEERWPALEDRLATAVDVEARTGSDRSAALAGLLAHDALARLGEIPVTRTVSRRDLGRAALFAVLGAAALLGAGAGVRTPARQALDAVLARVNPARITIDVQPGHAQVVTGDALRIVARVRGRGAPSPVLVREEGSARETVEMGRLEAGGGFSATVERIARPFTYHVESGPATSAFYAVAVVTPPRLVRIDLRYEYPPSLGLPPRVEEDSGDIYAPPGTRVRLRMTADRPVDAGTLALSDGTSVPARATGSTVLDASILVVADGSYRVHLRGRDGTASRADGRYFIRTLDDRPPFVRIVEPAGDRRVTALEEVTIAARAEDDYGIARFELVYAVSGGKESVRSLALKPGATTAEAAATLYLEDLDVHPGDFVSYYARAGDVGRGRQSTEARSDMFFLEVRPFREAFVPATSQAAGAGSRPIDELAAAQKDIIVATWKLIGRADAGTKEAPDDIRAIGRAQGELKARVEAASVAPGGRQTAGGTAPALSGGESPMARAVEAMARAERALGAARTAEALPHEMAAYKALLEARAEVRQWQVQRGRGQSGGQRAAGDEDLSAMFDRELRRQQQTSYELPSRAAAGDAGRDAALDRVRELARRQADLSREQQELDGSRDQLGAGEVQRQLDRLIREQAELHREVEELARQLAARREGTPRGQPETPARGGARGAADGSDGAGRGTAGRGEGGAAVGLDRAVEQLRQATGQMGRAAGELRREAPARASEEGGRALASLRRVEEALQALATGSEGRRLADRIGRVREARQRLIDAGERLNSLRAGRMVDQGGRRAGAGAGSRSRPGDPAPVGTAGRGDPIADARQAYRRALADAAALVSELRRAGIEAGITPEGQEMVLSAPSFNRDDSDWAVLRRDLELALEQADASLVRRLDRSALRGVLPPAPADRSPEAYRALIERYFQAIARAKGGER